MNGLRARIDGYLERNSLSQLVLSYIVSGDLQWRLNLRKLSRDERMLFHIGILSLVDKDANDDDSDRARLVSFTSGLIFRACIHSVFPKRTSRLKEILPPIALLEKALSYVRPSQLDIRRSSNLTGPSEHMFQIELYSVFRELLPDTWRCGSEAHPEQGDTKYRMDLLIMSDDRNRIGYELKVDKTTDKELKESIEKGLKYSRKFHVDVFLVNFLPKLSCAPTPVIVKKNACRVFIVNVTYSSELDEFEGRYHKEICNGVVENSFKVTPIGDGMGGIWQPYGSKTA
jgi:hypothetical protein